MPGARHFRNDQDFRIRLDNIEGCGRAHHEGHTTATTARSHYICFTRFARSRVTRWSLIRLHVRLRSYSGHENGFRDPGIKSSEASGPGCIFTFPKTSQVRLRPALRPGELDNTRECQGCNDCSSH